jgi:hypothetical protein
LGSLAAWFEEREREKREEGVGVLKEGSGSPLLHGRSGEVAVVRAQEREKREWLQGR